MICKKCGEEVREGATFCPRCGEKVMYKTNISESQQSKNNKLVPILGAIIVVLVLCIIVISNLNKSNTNVADNQNYSSTTVEVDVSEEKFAQIKDNIDEYITINSSHSNVSVSIIDNNTSSKISSNSADSAYTAWGFYLPIYYAYGTKYSFDDTAKNILSSDISLCNTNANNAINKLGGLYDLNEQLKHEFSVNTTNFGRFFAEVNASGDNYTNATEAVDFLYRLEKDGNYNLLSNQIHDFGIYEPSGASVYAQAGTENRAVLKNLNLFAIVKDDNLNYSVVILTRNNQGDILTDLLSFIHREMRNYTE